jgi:hypothetical protein
MSAFEYTSVMSSIIVGLALVDILISLNRLIRAGGGVRWHWAAPATALLIFLTIIQIWWSIYRPDGGPMTIGQFLPLVVELVILFLLAAAALPDDVPPGGLDLKLYYQGNSPYLWSLFAAALGWLLFIEILGSTLMGQPLLTVVEGHLVDLVVVPAFVALIFVRRLWIHAIALALFAVGPIGWLSRSLG